MHDKAAEWTQLRTLLAIARGGTLSHAARDLRIDQSTAGRHLKALENSYGVPLFVRGKTQMVPTEHGRAAIRAAERMESAVLEMSDEIGRSRQEPQGIVRVISIPWICRHLVLAALPGFAARHPKIEFQLVADALDQTIDRGECEMELRFERRPGRREVRLPLGKVRYFVYGPEGAAAKDLPWIGFRDPAHEYRPESFVHDARQGAPVQFWANDAGLLRDAVEAGLGKALLPEVVAASRPGLARVSEGPPDLERTLYLHTTTDALQLRRGKLARDWLTGPVAALLAPRGAGA